MKKSLIYRSMDVDGARQSARTLSKEKEVAMKALLLCAVAVGWVYSAAAPAEIITIQRADIAREIEAAVQCYIRPNGAGCAPAGDSRPDCSLYWASHTPGSSDRVNISRKNRTTIRADVHLKCSLNNLPNPDVYVHLDLALSCNWRDPSVKVSPARADVEVNWPWWVDVLSASVTWWAGNIGSRVSTSKLRASGALQNFVREVMVPLSYCPGISVQNNGSVQIDLAMGTECTNGQTRHQGCQANETGPGRDYICVGGRWGLSGGRCEPAAPPGGEVP